MDESDHSETKKKSSLLLRILFAKIKLPIDIIFVIIGLSVVATAYTMVNVPQLSILINPQVESQNEINRLIEEVSKLISLPEGEKPLVASILDIEKINEQPFFAKAQNGDKVLLYSKAKKAILYRPEEKLIIEVGTVNIE